MSTSTSPSPTLDRAGEMRPAALDDHDLAEALDSACATVGQLEPRADVWPELAPLVHQLCDLVDDRPQDSWSDNAVLASRRLAHVVRRWQRRARTAAAPAEAVVRTAGLIEVVAATHAARHAPR